MITISSKRRLSELLVKRVALDGGRGLLSAHGGVAQALPALSRRARRGNAGEIRSFMGSIGQNGITMWQSSMMRAVAGRCRISDDAAELTVLTGLLAEHAGDEATGGGVTPVDIALETDGGLLVAPLRAADPPATSRSFAGRGHDGEKGQHPAAS